MIQIVALLRRSPAARWIAAGVGCAVISALAYLAFTWWLSAHDRAVRAEYLVELQGRARKESAKAASEADKASAERKVITDETQDRIANSSSVDELFDGLRGQGGTK